MPLRQVLLGSLLATLLATGLAAQVFRVGIIDLYGMRTVPAAAVRAALTVREGDSLDMGGTAGVATLRASEDRLRQLPSVADAEVHLVCCESGALLVYVGVAERGTPPITFRAAPAGAARLPSHVVEAGDRYMSALLAAMQRGDATEDRSRGYALAHDPATRAVQEQFVVFAREDEALLREVLRTSADSGHRALAAQVLGYVPDPRTVVDDLAWAMQDPSDDVRNNAMRALWVFADAGGGQADLRIPAAPFVVFLNSLAWTDRNKASVALMSLTASRDPAVLDALRTSAVPSLVEMARWRAPGHAFPAYLVLARLTGTADDDAIRAWEQGDRETVITAAERAPRDP